MQEHEISCEFIGLFLNLALGLFQLCMTQNLYFALVGVVINFVVLDLHLCANDWIDHTQEI